MAAHQKLRIRGVRKSYGQVIALDETDLDLAEGEFLTLLGPSGSGKTTLLMTVAGLTVPDRGDIWIDGKLASYLPVHQRAIGMVFQNYALFPHLSVFENIAFPLRMRRVPQEQIKRDVAFALETVRLSGMAQRLPRELSGGQQQRVALARCFVYRPSIILMDEPLGALDKKLRDEMQLEIKQLHSELGITVLYVTHDQEEALVMSDRICLMNQGGIEQIGTAHELYFRPLSLFAAQFLGDSNVLPVTVEEVGPHVALKGPQGSRIAAAASEPVAKGLAAHVMVRPENLRVLAANESARNVLEGVVAERHHARRRDAHARQAGLWRSAVEQEPDLRQQCFNAGGAGPSWLGAGGHYSPHAQHDQSARMTSVGERFPPGLICGDRAGACAFGRSCRCSRFWRPCSSIPCGQLLALSFADGKGAFSLVHYARLFASPVYVQVLIITFKVAAWTTLLCLVAGYPVAYLLATTRPNTRGMLILWVLLPFWTSFLVRTFAWIVLLGRNGAVNKWLTGLGIIDAPLSLIYNFTA